MVFVSVICIMAGSSMAASVGSVRLRYTGASPSSNLNVTLVDHFSMNTSAGVMNLQLDPNWSGTWGEGNVLLDQANANNQIKGFCTDLFQYAYSNWATYDVIPAAEGPKGGQNAQYHPDGMGQQKASDMLSLFSNYLDQVVNSATATAFQLAVWEIAFETSDTYNVANGNGQFYTSTNSSFVNIANDWLANLGSADPNLQLRVLTSPDHQDYVTAFVGHAPEPLTLIGVTLGVLAAVFYMRKRIQAQKAVA